MITSHLIFEINVTPHKKCCVCACVFMRTHVGVDWQFQQMCRLRWQHDIYFAWSIWHVCTLPCILSWCEVIARDVQPHWNHSPLSLVQQYENVFLPTVPWLWMHYWQNIPDTVPLRLSSFKTFIVMAIGTARGLKLTLLLLLYYQ